MPDIRRGVRSRNNKRGNKLINLKLLTIVCIIAILLFSGLLIYKSHQNALMTAKMDEEIEKNLYSLFEEVENATKSISGEEKAEDTKIKIVTVGDILCENSIIEDTYNSKTESYDFSHIFSNVKKYTSNSDITLGLLETNFVDGEKYSGSGKYNSPNSLAVALKDIGIDILHTASNHSLDYGFEGVKATLDYLETLEIDTLGTYKTEEESSNILVKDVQGIKLAFLSYTYGTNTKVDHEHTFCINVIDREKVKNDMQKAKEQGVDFTFVHMHWGDVDAYTQNNNQKELADFLFDNGADFILGSHPAALQPMEIRQNDNGKNVFIAYSTGNFISASRYNYSNIEMILNIEVTKKAETGETYLSKVTYEPVYLLDRGTDAKDRYILLSIKEGIEKYENGDISNIDEKTYNQLKQAFTDIEKLIGKE